MPNSHVSLASVTLGKALALSGPWFPIHKTRKHFSDILSGTEDILVPKPSPTSCSQQSISAGESRDVGQEGNGGTGVRQGCAHAHLSSQSTRCLLRTRPSRGQRTSPDY